MEKRIMKKKDDEPQRYKDFFNSFNEASETDEILQQLVNLNFDEKKPKSKNNNNFKKEKISKIKFENYINNNNENSKEEKPISIVLLKEKINRINISMQGLNFKENELNYLVDFISCLNYFEQRNYPQVDKLLDVFNSLISRIKDEINVKNKFIQKLNEASLDIENYEKKNIINQRVIKDKENEMIILMNKLNLEKEKNEDQLKSIYLEINSLKKENQELSDTILIYKNKLRKTEAEYQVVNEKYKNNIIKENNTINSTSIISTNEEKSENGLNNSKMNDSKYFNIKKWNMSLTYLLKEINKMIVKYDNSLIKLLYNNKNNSDKVIDLNCNIETNLLLDDANMKIFRKNFLYNMERIYKKIDILQRGNIDYRELKNSKNLNISNNSNILNKSNISTNNDGSGNNKDINFKNNISSKWYDKYNNNKKIGYVFDKEKVITCEDDDNGAK